MRVISPSELRGNLKKYLDLAKKYSYRYRLIDASLSPNKVFEQAQNHIALALGIKA